MATDFNLIKKKIGNTIKALRIRNNLSQSDLADKLGVSKSIISAYEKGIRNPSLETLVKLSDILDFPISGFFYDNIPDKPTTTIDVSQLTEQQINVVRVVVKQFVIENTEDEDDDFDE